MGSGVDQLVIRLMVAERAHKIILERFFKVPENKLSVLKIGHLFHGDRHEPNHERQSNGCIIKIEQVRK